MAAAVLPCLMQVGFWTQKRQLPVTLVALNIKTLHQATGIPTVYCLLLIEIQRMLHKKHVSTSRSQGLYRSRAKMSEPLLTRISTTLACSGPRTVIQAGSSGTSDLDASISGCHKLQDCNQTLKSPSIYDLSNPCGKLHMIPCVRLNRRLHLSWSDLRFATPSTHHILPTQLLPQQHAKVWP